MSECDKVFGPRVSSSCRKFDFTLYFEDLILAIFPATAFLLLLPIHVRILLRSQDVVRHSGLLAAKCSVFFALTISQTTFLALRSSNLQVQTGASLAADILCLASTIGATVLSWMDHHRSIRPSTLLAVYLGGLVVLEIARLRTLWLVEDGLALPITLTSILTLTFAAMMLESSSKHKSLRSPTKYVGTSSESFSGFWKRVGFVWLIGTMMEGYRSILNVDDLPALDPRLKTSLSHMKLKNTWTDGHLDYHIQVGLPLKRAGCVHSKNSLLKACFRAYFWPFLAAVVPRLCLTGFTFAQPFMIDTLTQFTSDRETSTEYGKGMIGAYALVYLGMAISTSVYWYQTTRFLARLRGGLISLIYQQTVQLRASYSGEITGLALMGTDVDRIMSGFRSIHEVWASILEISLAIYLLERQLQLACIVPGAITLIFIMITFKLSAMAKISQRHWIERVEKRLSATTNMLGNMKAVKMLGFTNKIFEIVDQLQKIEVVKSSKYRKNLIGQVFFSNSPSVLTPVATFAVYVVVATREQNDSLLASRAFTSLSLISLLTNSVLMLIQAIPSMIQCLSCFDRIQEYCCQHYDKVASEKKRQNYHFSTRGEYQDSTIVLQDYIVSGERKEEKEPSSDIISFHGQSFGWSKAGPIILKSLDLQIKANMITLVLGPTASGKSTLLESIIGETVPMDGWTERNFSSAAYCSQVPWVINGTIREAIIGASPIDEDWYDSVMRACALETDLALLGQGDSTVVGNNGLNVSGGQRQRIALARAVYSRQNLLLLDDVFSGVDPPTTELITNRLIGQDGLLRRSKTTVVIATHLTTLAPFADCIVVLGDGRILEAGSIESFRESGTHVAKLDCRSSSLGRIATPLENPMPVDGRAPEEHVLSSLREETVDLRRQSGNFSVYKYYSQSAGHKAVAAFIASMALWAFCENFSTVWLDWWSDANARNQQNNNVGTWLGVYAALGISATVITGIACWLLFVEMITKSVRRLHHDLLKTALRAPLSFFYETDIGSITNRFSQDMELVGMDFPVTAINYVSAVCDCVAQAAILAVYGKYLAVTLPLVLAAVYFVQKFYLRTSRQLRLLDIEAKAPLYLHFIETTNGAKTIRAFGWESSFQQTLESLLDRSQQAIYSLYCVQQWLALVLDLIVSALAIILVSIIVIWRASFNSGAVGVALVMVMNFNKTLMSVVKHWTSLETSVGALSRIKAFVDTTVSELPTSETVAMPLDWPVHGTVVYTDVTASHIPGGESVLKNISISIQAGEKVAICGHSGSGKTSFIVSLLQMIDTQSGTIMIDGIDISGLNPAELRQRINVVPQDPFTMPGSVRFNMDPYQSASEDVIIGALQRVGLWQNIRNNGGLDEEITAASWSAGEMQIFCLARALIRNSPILILDEATGSVDLTTEATIAEVINTEFTGCTVLAIIHRLDSIRQYDKVMVLQSGELVEYDKPGALLGTDSRLLRLYEAGGYESSS